MAQKWADQCADVDYKDDYKRKDPHLWSECSQSCGGGTRTKVRECASGRNYEGCVGESELTEDCNEQKCPAWTDWTEWTVCTKSCGGGKRSKVCCKK